MTFAAMQQWLSYQIYPNENTNVFLVRALRPFLESQVWPHKSARAFFVRYDDAKGPHIRLRLRAEEEFLKQVLEPNALQYFETRGDIVQTVYEPETERFGGPDGLAWAEEHFHQSSRVVLERMRSDLYTYGDSMFDALRLHVIMAHAAGFDPKRAGWYFGKLYEQWLPLFFSPPESDAPASDWKEEVRADFEKSLEPQRFTIVDALSRFWNDLKKEKIDREHPEWLRWFRANQLILKELGDNLDKAMPSLLHLTNNRLGISNQDEVYLNFMLSKVL